MKEEEADGRRQDKHNAVRSSCLLLLPSASCSFSSLLLSVNEVNERGVLNDRLAGVSATPQISRN
jgi:hypothetical protein